MNTLPFNGYLAVPIARQMISAREPYRIADPGAVIRSFEAAFVRLVEETERSITVAEGEDAFCIRYPSECAGIA